MQIRIVPALLLCQLVFPICAIAAGHCGIPKFNRGAVWEESESSVFMAVSIPLQDFAPSKLVCLAQEFRRRYPNRDKIEVLIFSSRDAANVFDPYPVGDSVSRSGEKPPLSHSSWLSELHGFYLYDARNNDEHLSIRPFGSDFDGGPDDTRITLPVSGTPRCHLEINGRCLLALEGLVYPDDALAKSVSGTVTFTGLVDRTGRMTHVRAAEIRVAPPEQREFLVNEAASNLQSWRFEPASRNDEIRITYSYVIDPFVTIPEGYRKYTKSQLELPNQVTIRGHVLK